MQDCYWKTAQTWQSIWNISHLIFLLNKYVCLFEYYKLEDSTQISHDSVNN